MLKSIKSEKNILYTVMLIIVITVCFTAAFAGVNKIAKVSCADTLGDTAENLAQRVENSMQCNIEELEVIADLISSHQMADASDIAAHLNSFKQRRMICSLAVLLPDGEIIYPNQPEFVLASGVDFESEKSLAPYISGRCDGENEYMYYTQPLFIGDSGDVNGILYGFIDLTTLPSLFSTSAYEGQCKEYIIDGLNGDFFMDTWHEQLGNLNVFGERETKPGYSWNDMNTDISNGVEGYVIFRSETTGSFFHAAYCPIGEGRFSVMITVPESAVFAKANKIKQIFFIVAAVNLCAFSMYFFVILMGVRKSKNKSEMQLKRTVHMYGIQKLLFEAYKDSGLVTEALKVTAEAVGAEGAMLVSYDSSTAGDVYTWYSEGSKLKDVISSKELVLENEFVEQLKRGETVCFEEKNFKPAEAKGVKNTLLTPVLNNEAVVVGILGVANLRHENEENIKLLEGIARDFMMALHDMESHKLIVEMGTIDPVTGLKNRAAYQKALKDLEQVSKGKICCVYIDANGLHDLNNSLGHAAGDAMLRYLAAKLKVMFGEETFRIGGDEFVAFLFDVTAERVGELLRAYSKDLEEHSYSASAGYSLMEAPVRSDRLVGAAEQEMYASKHRYYSENKNIEKAREMNHKLEKILLEKKDSDNFLKIISSYFMGVYVVNLATDDTRIIYAPEYFRKMLQQTGFKFSEALRMYADEYVVDEDRENFLRLFNYSAIERAIAERVPEIVYSKPNGSSINVRIFGTGEDSAVGKETFWLFELHNNS